MEVDPEILRAFAGQVDNAATLIREADVGTKVTTNVSDMGTAVRRAGNAYGVTDDELAVSFDGIF